MIVVLTTLSIVGTVTGVGMLAPQLWRVRRSGDLRGISFVWMGVGISMNAWWLAYAVEGRRWGLIPVAALGMLCYGELARNGLRLRSTGVLTHLLGGGILLGWVPLVSLAFAGWAGAGLAIGLCYGVQFIPAAIEAWRSTNIDGLSPATWVLALIEALAWLGYGLLTADPALIIGGIGGSVMSVAILGRVVYDRPEAPRSVRISWP